MLAELGDEAKVLAGGQSLIPMLALRLAGVRPPGRHRPHRRARSASSRATTGSWVGAPTTEADGRAQRARSRAAVPLLSPGDPVHRALPDPQPGHGRWLDRPRRPGGRVPGGGAGPRRRARRGLAAGRAHHRRPATSSRACGTRRSSPTSCSSASVPDLDRPLRLRGPGAGPPPRRLRHRRRGRRRASSTATTGSAAAPSACSDWDRRPRAARRPSAGARAARSATSIADELGRLAMSELDSVPADLHGSAAYRARVGAAMVARAWTAAIGGGARWREVDGRDDGQRRVAARRRRAPAHAGRLPARALRPDRHPPRLRARRVRRLHRAASTARPCARAWCSPSRPTAREVTTIEGLASPDGELSPVQAAFRDCHGLQCGFCTPGFVVSVTAFLRDHPDPTDERDPRGPVGQPVPLHRLPGDHPGRPPGRGRASRGAVVTRHRLLRPGAASRGRGSPHRGPAPAHRARNLRGRHSAARDAARVLRAEPTRPGSDPSRST